MKTTLLLTGFLTTFFIIACQPKPTGGNLTDTSWRLISYIDGTEKNEVPSPIEITAIFDDGKMSGKGVCNRYFAEYETKQANIQLGPIGATKMLCPENADLEQQYFDLLSRVESYSANEKLLVIDCQNGQLVFETWSAEKPDDPASR